MFVLDTNHLRELCYDSPVGRRLRSRMENGAVVATIVTVEEACRGWLAKIASYRDPSQQVWAYGELEKLFMVTSGLVRLPWDDEAASRFRVFRQQGIRVGTMDLKIACITLEYDAILLTRNRADFEIIPGLHYENWLD
ncbi:MAG: type II toxin-antitoxin system VapC family toxin [Prosthecobacter sp.]|uniref:type II toxin-antitoxin system VapC family toxin n=1 Tax=Prosthecobacter sp. TaxID=1965333 RepID=UPI0039011826